MTPQDFLTHTEAETPDNPFPGLRPFEFGESHLYFGRDGQSDQLIRKLSATRFVAVVGTSGSGKSSLVRAGLLPGLFSGYMSSAGSHWRVALMRPGNDPLGNLAAALNSTGVFGSDIEENAQIQTAITEATLRRGSLGLVEAVRQNRMPSNESLLVVVDQFEELFRFARVSGSEQYRYEAAAFIKLLLDASAQREQAVYVVLTMRSDFLGDCSMFWDLPEAINEGQYLIPRLTRDQRMEAVAGPVAVCGGDIAQRLVTRLLNDMGDNPDQLPILQHALMRTWENWEAGHAEGEAVDMRHYEAIGGMGKALSRHADEAWGELPDARARLVAEKIFKALTEKGEDNREVRRPVELRSLCQLTDAGEAEVVAVLEVFRRAGRSFLMPPASVRLEPDSLVDISHESLIRNWERLKAWVDEESVSAQIYRRLAETAALHAGGRAGLWRDPDLQIALDWRERARPNAAWAARYHPAFDAAMTFLDESVEARDAAARDAEARRRREVRRARLVAAVFFLLFMLSLAAVAFAYNKTQLAQGALSNLQEATIQTRAALAQAESSATQARQAAENERTSKQTEADQREKAETAETVAVNKQKEAEAAKAEAVHQAEIARTNERQATAAKAEAETQRATAVTAAEKSRQFLYAADINLTHQAYEANNVARGRELLEAHKPVGVDEARKSGGAEAPGFDWYYLWHLFHSESHTLMVSEDEVNAIALFPDGKTLAVGMGTGALSYRQTVALYETGTLTEWKRIVMGGEGHLNSMAISPDGTLLAVGGAHYPPLKLIDTKSWADWTLLKLETSVNAVVFSPDGKLLATGDADYTVRLWDVATKKEVASLKIGSMVRSLAFSPGGEMLYVGFISGVVQMIDVSSREQAGMFEAHKTSVVSLTFTPDGKFVATGSADGTVKLWNTDPVLQKLAFTFNRNQTPVTSVALSPDGRVLVISYADGVIKLWDATSREELATLKGHLGPVISMRFTPDGRWLLTGSLDKSVKVWDIPARIREQTPLGKHTSVIWAVAFSLDGKLLATSTTDKTVKLWHTDTGQERCSLKEMNVAVKSVAFSPDGKMFATGSQFQTFGEGEGPVGLWDANSCAKLAMPKGHTDMVTSVAFSPDGKLIATGSRDRTVRLWDTALFKQVGLPLQFARPVMSVAFSSDGKRLAVGIGNETITVWDVTSPTPIELLRLPVGIGGGDVNSLAFAPATSDRPGRRLLAAGFENGIVKLLDADTGRELAPPLRGHKEAVLSVAFSPDGRTLATGSEDSTVKLWDAVSFKELITLNGHEDAVLSIAFSPDGKTLATGSFDTTVRLWHAATDKEVKEFEAAEASRQPN